MPEAILSDAAAVVRERRRSRRYRLRLALDYQARAAHAGPWTGRGETTDISSEALLFSANAPLPVGSVVELFIDWPMKLENAAGPVLLKVNGTVLRCSPRGVVVLINRARLSR